MVPSGPTVMVLPSGLTPPRVAVDATGSADKNAELAKERAQAVAKLLTDSGIAADRIEMRKPQTLTAGSDGADKQARRVDIVAAQ